jgi:putative ABC transport system permease protein
MAAVGLVMLIACANVANLQLARGVARQKEMGIRTSLEAQPAGVVRLLVLQAGKLVGIGVGVGLAAAVVAMRILSGFLYGISALDGFTFVGVTIMLAGIALLACYIPARRATKVDPMIALRYE